jgi:hypothetical protein
VKRQLQAMGVPGYELGVYHRERDAMRNFTLTAPEVLKRVGWLKRENSQGCDIYIRPQGSLGLVFFDDVSRATVERLKADGLSPAVVLESSPLNFQGWIRVSETPIAEALATALCKLLVSRYGGDKDSADWRHYGRLAGFTNRKACHVSDTGQHPFVLLTGSQGKLAEQGAALLSAGQQRLEEGRRQQVYHAPATRDDSDEARGFFKAQLAELLSQYGEAMDTSRADWMIIRRMMQAGFTRHAISEALKAHSLAVAKRKGNHAVTYLTVTLDNAFDGVTDNGSEKG